MCRHIQCQEKIEKICTFFAPPRRLEIEYEQVHCAEGSMSETIAQKTDKPDDENPVGLTIGSLVCAGVAIILFFASCIPDFGGESIVWGLTGLALTLFVAVLAVAALKSDMPKKHKLLITAGAGVPVFLYAYSLACTVLSS